MSSLKRPQHLRTWTPLRLCGEIGDQGRRTSRLGTLRLGTVGLIGERLRQQGCSTHVSHASGSRSMLGFPRLPMRKAILAIAILLCCLVVLASAATSRSRTFRSRSPPALGSNTPSSIPFNSGESILLPDSLCHRPQAQVQDCFDVRIWYTACWTGILRWNADEGAATAKLIIPLTIPVASGSPPVSTLVQDCGTGDLYYALTYIPQQLMVSDPHGAKPPSVVQPNCIALSHVAGIGELWFQCAGMPIQHLDTATGVITPIPMGSVASTASSLVLDLGLHTMYILDDGSPVYTYDISTPTVPPSVLLTAEQCPESQQLIMRVPGTDIILAACHYLSITAFDLKKNTSAVVLLGTEICTPQSSPNGFAWSARQLLERSERQTSIWRLT
jgi:hypothetical protein